MFVTMAEASVPRFRETELREAWDALVAAGDVPAGFIESSLLRSGDAWRIVTVWESANAVLAMRSAGQPAALVILEAAGGHADVSMWTVEGRLRP